MSTAHVVWNGFYQHWKPSSSHQRDQTRAQSQQRRLCLLVLVRFLPPSQKTGRKRTNQRLITDPWLGFKRLRLQIKLSSFKEQRCHSPAPGPLNVTDQLRGVNAHFSQLSRRRDGGQRKTEEGRGHPAHKYQGSLKYLIVLQKRTETAASRTQTGNLTFMLSEGVWIHTPRERVNSSCVSV